MNETWSNIGTTPPKGGKVMLRNKTGEIAYGMHVFNRHFLDEGRWLIMGHNPQTFCPVEYRECTDKEEQEFTKQYSIKA